MIGFWDSVLSGVFANIFFAVAIFVFCYLIVLWRRQPILRFFGVFGNRTLHIHLSQIQVLPGGSFGVDGRPRSYNGTAVVFSESRSLIRFREILDVSIPGQENLLQHFRRLLLSDVVIEAHPAPNVPTTFDLSNSFVTLGSPGYNGMSQWIQDNRDLMAQFEHENSRIAYHNDFVENGHYGFIQRVRLNRRGQVGFYAAGISEPATFSAYQYLTDSWRDLNARYGHRSDFCEVFSVNPQNSRDREVLYSNTITWE